MILKRYKMLEKDLLSIVRDFAQENPEKYDIHGFSHSERVNFLKPFKKY